MTDSNPVRSAESELYVRRARALTRRHFFRQCHVGLGAMALASLLPDQAPAAPMAEPVNPLAPRPPHFTPKAKAVIYLHMSGSPPQQEMFDWKPKLVEHHMQPCPSQLLEGRPFPFIKGHPLLLGTPYKFARYGQSGAWISELLPGIAGMADDIAFVKSMFTDQINHAPAELYLFTGAPRAGSPSMGSWVTYGLGSESEDLPGYVVLLSGGTDPSGGKSLWGSGFLPSVYQGVQCRSEGEPILYVSNPNGMSRDVRRRSLDALGRLNEFELEQFGDPETLTRIAQYELAYRMQISVPDVMDISRESQQVLDMYGAQPGAGTFANNCLQARRLVERGVRFVQLFDWGWDCHGTGEGDDIVKHLPKKCKEIDRPISALLADLKARGMLEETLVVWGGEFGRTAMNEARDGSKFLGRDHHPHCFTVWMAGGGIQGGISYGETDELSYFVANDPMPIHDLQATILHLLGLDPHRHAYKFQGLNQRLIGPTEEPKVNHALLA
ncbi:MAG: DUF1501 domain-containing protein [Pirellulales bacterium]